MAYATCHYNEGREENKTNKINAYHRCVGFGIGIIQEEKIYICLDTEKERFLSIWIYNVFASILPLVNAFHLTNDRIRFAPEQSFFMICREKYRWKILWILTIEWIIVIAVVFGKWRLISNVAMDFQNTKFILIGPTDNIA